MSRIRSIKPDFWTSEQVVSCSPHARLLFIGLWNFCDDHGIHPASYVRIKAEIFPCDNFEMVDIQAFIHELIQHALLREYVVDEKTYWLVTGWKNHQRIDKPTYRHPLPQAELKKRGDNLTTIRRELDEAYLSTPEAIAEPSATEWNGVERNGGEVNICEVETSPVPVSSDTSSTHAHTQEIFKHWQTAMNHPKAKLDDKRQRVIKKALALGYSVDELKQAIDGCANTPFNMGENERRQTYDDITLILRDAEHVERFINNANGTSNITKGTDDLMIGVI